MISKTTAPLLISAEEVAKLFKRAGTVGSVERAIAIQRAYSAISSYESSLESLLVLGAIYDGGRIQGIREERAKRDTKKRS